MSPHHHHHHVPVGFMLFNVLIITLNVTTLTKLKIIEDYQNHSPTLVNDYTRMESDEGALIIATFSFGSLKNDLLKKHVSFILKVYIN